MKLQWILILILLTFTVGLTAQATNLIISEYVEGTSYQKALEIFNGTGGAIDLSTVSIKKQTNGAGTFGSELILSGTLANNDVFVIVNSTGGGTNLVGQPYVDLATASQAVNFNGNDAVALFRNGIMIDVIGIVDDPTIWGADMTMVRNSTIASPTTTYNVAEWTQYPINTFSYLGAHTFTGGTTDPTIIVSNPNTAVTWYYGQTYTIGWSSANITGNVKIDLMNSTEIIPLAASVEDTGSWVWTIPTTIPSGTQFKIKVSTLNDLVSDTSNEFFSIMELPVTNVATLAQLRTMNPDGTTIYRVTGDVILTYQQTYRNKKYFQDATAAIEIDDVNVVINTQFQIGDAVSNLMGTLTTYHNLLQLVPYVNPGGPTSTGNDIVSPIVTINELNTNFESYESRLVFITNASFMDTSMPFATGTVYNVSDATGQIVFRTNFFEADYIGQAIPAGPITMRVITTQYDDTYQITARALADFTPVSNSDEVTEYPVLQLLNNYPNPFTGSTSIAFRSKNTISALVEIYNLKGQLVKTLMQSNVKDGINYLVWDSRDANGNTVPAGIYLYHMKGGKYTSSGKMILLK